LNGANAVDPEERMGIRQLASELHLSIGTVSRALNDRPDVNPETRARVKAAAARAGYVPNQSGRSLRSGRTGIVAAVIPTRAFAPSADSGLFTVLEGARRTLRRHALDLIVLFRGPDEDPLENLQRIVQRRIADAVIISSTVARDPRLAYLQAAGIEYVTFGRSAGLEGYPFVDHDIEGMAAEAARVFVGDGHRRLALAVDDEMQNYEDMAFASFAAEAVRLGLPPSSVRLIRLRDGRISEADRASFARRGSGPTAVLATHEWRAAAIYAVLDQLGLKVGADVSVICTFPCIDTRGLSPALSHFQADLDAVGVALAEQLIARLPDSRVEPRPAALIPLRFAPRASHGRAPIAVQGVTQAPLRPEDRTQASTKATPVTPSSIVG
jgi:DNA-binding LacI/PurR family transcriptional regulator